MSYYPATKKYKSPNKLPTEPNGKAVRPVPAVVDGYPVELSTNKSGYMGITYSNGRYRAELGSVRIGQYLQLADAVRARTRAKIKQEASKKRVDSHS